MTILERLERRRKINPETGCWEWIGSKLSTGYGAMHFRINGKRIIKSVHRIAYELYLGKISDGMCVLHHCDNRICFNPAHLFMGTLGDNNRDCKAKGRNAFGKKHGSKTKPGSLPAGNEHWSRVHPEMTTKGSKHGSAKLTEFQVVKIRSKYSSGGYTLKMLASESGVSAPTINNIVLRKNWKHV